MTQPVGKLVGVCNTPEELLVYIARVSNPSNQTNMDTASKLLLYCLREKHVSIFETVNLTFEIETSRAIMAQVLRHNSFRFQEFSQRYAVVVKGHQDIELRVKGSTNRQGSLEVSTNPVLTDAVKDLMTHTQNVYEVLLQNDIAPESARMILPLATTTTAYMTGNIRSWIFYLEQRTSDHAQKEHRLLAQAIQAILVQHFPVLAEALNWHV